MAATLVDISEWKGVAPGYGRSNTKLEPVLATIYATIKNHRHDSTTAAEGTKLNYSDLADKQAISGHATCPDRIVPVPVLDFLKLDLSLPTSPMLAMSSSVAKITWAGGVAGQTIVAQAQVPDNYDQSLDTIALKMLARSQAAGTTTRIRASISLVRGGVAITEIMSGSSVALSTGGTLPEEKSLAVSYNTLNQQDMLTITLDDVSGAGASIEFWGAWLEYTGEM